MRWEEEPLTPFFALSLNLLCVTGMDGSFRRMNPAGEDILGWASEDLRTKFFLDLVHPADRAATEAEIHKLERGLGPIAFANRYLGKDGQYRWLRWRAGLGPDCRTIYASAVDVSDQKRLEGEIFKAADREKERIGRDLHDGLCQDLSGLAALSEMLTRKLQEDSHRTAAEAAEITKLLNKNIGHARDLAQGLDPAGLAQIGLAAALENFAANIRSCFHLCCILRCDRPLLRLVPEVEAHLYRIAQEAVHNAVRHGRATRIEIRLRLRGRTGRLCIRDNGSGMAHGFLPAGGLGMHTMDYRARHIGGFLRVTGVRRGLAVTCSFPLPTDASADQRHS